jgi:ATP-dependent NAD(P)H-hydrate dehydratase
MLNLNKLQIPHQKIIQILKENIIPSFSNKKTHKGQHGRICTIGGSKYYTGAPFYSSISSLKTGTDLSFVICSKNIDTVTSLKSYSPELIGFLKKKN